MSKNSKRFLNQLSDYSEPEWILPFEEMKIGDSFFIPSLQPTKASYPIYISAKRAGVKIKCYVARHDGLMGLRVWRIG